MAVRAAVDVAYGASQRRCAKNIKSRLTSGSLTITYANGAELRGDATCVSADGNIAYVIARIVASSDARWALGDYIAVGIDDRGATGDAVNFCPGLAAEPACAAHRDARPVLPIDGDFSVHGG